MGTPRGGTTKNILDFYMHRKLAKQNKMSDSNSMCVLVWLIHNLGKLEG